MLLSTNEIHVWSINLTIGSAKEQAEKISILSADECKRANSFRFPIHQQRFIAARYGLRRILSLYLNVTPQEIEFAYTNYKKPYLLNPTNSALQFNLAHSENIGVYAMTLNHAVGIDIEKIHDTYNIQVAQRFFNNEETSHLMLLPVAERRVGFYRIWARKEALIKAIGKGLFLSLSSFCVATNDIYETITLENETWSLLPLALASGYQAALASNQPIKAVSHWQFFDHTYHLKENLFPERPSTF